MYIYCKINFMLIIQHFKFFIKNPPLNYFKYLSTALRISVFRRRQVVFVNEDEEEEEEI